MADLKYYDYPGVGEENKKNFNYSQAVRVGDQIECSGQGGWEQDQPDANNMPREINAQIAKAFENVDLALKTAGGKGWSQVFRVNSYHVPLNNEALEAMAKGFAKWCPDHKPLWTTVGVQRLGLDDMRVEIEVRAYDPEDAKKA